VYETDPNSQSTYKILNTSDSIIGSGGISNLILAKRNNERAQFSTADGKSHFLTRVCLKEERSPVKLAEAKLSLEEKLQKLLPQSKKSEFLTAIQKKIS
jgi:hypothetical protein